MVSLLKWYYERRKDKVIFVRPITEEVNKIVGGCYVDEGSKKVKYKKNEYGLGKTSILNRFGKKIHFFDIENLTVMGSDVLSQVGMTKEELDAYTNGGVIATLKNFLKKSVSDWLLIVFSFIAGAGAMSFIQGLI